MADAFDQAWGLVKARPDNPHQEFLGGGVMEGRMGVPEEEPAVELEPTIEESDHCCEKVRQEFKDYLIWAASKGSKDAETISWLIDDRSCEELYTLMESLAPAHPRAKEMLTMWDKCSEENNMLEMSNDSFEDAWALSKVQPGLKRAWETYESGDSMPAFISGLSGNKGKRHYQKFLTDAFGRTGSEELADANIGGGGGLFAIRPHVAYVGNDWNRYIPNLFRNVRDNPRALRWNPEEEYTRKEGEARTFPHLRPGGGVVELPPLTAQDVKTWHEITGGLGLDEDTMYDSNLRFFELRRQLNEMMDKGKWRTDPDESAKMARQTAILLPQMIGGHFRIGDEEKHSLNIGPRGPSPKQKDLVRTKYPEAWKQAAGLLHRIKTEAVGEDGKPWKGVGGTGVGGYKHDDAGQVLIDESGWPTLTPPGTLSMNTTVPYRPQRIGLRGEKEYDYEPWSREMRDKDYFFHEGDHVPFLDRIGPLLSPENRSFLLSDPPYYKQAGEHHTIASDRGEPGGFSHRLMSAIRPIVDRGVPTAAFNSGLLPKKLWDTAGLTDYKVWPRSQKGIAQKGGETVAEMVGMANIPEMSQRKVDEMQDWPDAELPARAFFRHTAFGR